MLHTEERTSFISRHSLLLCGGLFAATILLLPASVQAQCTQWDTGGEWEIRQSNGFRLFMDLSQSGKTITGKAGYGTVGKGGFLTAGDPEWHTVSVDGNIEGDDFYVMIGLSGVYRGKVGASGRLDGSTYDSLDPSSKATWFSSRSMKCAPPPAVPAPAPPPVLSRTGRARATPAPELKPPFITAGQPINVQPGLPFASVYLGWEGGADHRTVDVWVSIDNAADVPAFSMDIPRLSPVFRQASVPAIEMKLAKGHVYKFSLKDAGRTLSTVVTVP